MESVRMSWILDRHLAVFDMDVLTGQPDDSFDNLFVFGLCQRTDRTIENNHLTTSRSVTMTTQLTKGSLDFANDEAVIVLECWLHACPIDIIGLKDKCIEQAGQANDNHQENHDPTKALVAADFFAG